MEGRREDPCCRTALPHRFLPFAQLRVGMTARVIVRSLCMLLTIAFLAATATAAPPDLTKEPTLYVVGYAHLDTQWRWEYPRTIGEFLPKTLHDNFVLFEKYPHYIFNFSGANRYRMMKLYYPAEYERLKSSVLDFMIDDLLVEQKAKELNLDVEAEVNQQMIQTAKDNGFAEFLAQMKNDSANDPEQAAALLSWFNVHKREAEAIAWSGTLPRVRSAR